MRKLSLLVALAAMGVLARATDVVAYDPGAFVPTTVTSVVTARGRIDRLSAGSWKSGILKGSTLLANGGVQNNPNPWLALNGVDTPFQFLYNATTGQSSFNILGRNPVANQLPPQGMGLYGFSVFNRVQTASGSLANSLALSGLTVSVNGGPAQSISNMMVSANEQKTRKFYFSDAGATHFVISGFVKYTSPQTWGSSQEGTSFNITPLAASPVPEPGTMVALGLGALALLRRRKATPR